MNSPTAQMLLEKMATPFEKSVVLGQRRKKSKNHRYETAKLTKESQRKGIKETTWFIKPVT